MLEVELATFQRRQLFGYLLGKSCLASFVEPGVKESHRRLALLEPFVVEQSNYRTDCRGRRTRVIMSATLAR